ncbi:MAG: hypothetical protein KAT31_02195 [Bacteroidales bacterium]|nr:hypothetical protein [Bacteroidales bacterium]
MDKTRYMRWVGVLAVLAVWFVPLGIFAQSEPDTLNMIRYTPEFEFRDGIFLNHQQMRNNAPIPKSRVITNVDYDDREYFTKVLENKTLLFYDHLGMKQEVRSKDVWGFSRNGILYIAIDDKYHRITIVGKICHFVATITTYDSRYYDPYYYNPYDYYYRYGGYPSNYSSSEMRQYLLDFEGGKVYDYDVEALEVMLMKDPELHDEFIQLRKKKRRQLKFLYLRKFNERNPLYIPKL